MPGVDLNIASTARRPGGSFSLEVHDKDFPTTGLDDDEAKMLEAQMSNLVTELDNEVLSDIVQNREETIAKTAAFAKHIFDEKNFDGMVDVGDNAIGFDLLRPGHILTSPEVSDVNNWYFDPGTTGWVDYVGDGTSSGNYTFGEDQVTLVLGVVDQDVDSEISGFNVQEFGRNMDMIPYDMNSMRLGDNPNEIKVHSVPSLLGQENDDVHVRLRYDRNVESQPRLFGFTFGLGSFLNTEDY